MQLHIGWSLTAGQQWSVRGAWGLRSCHAAIFPKHIAAPG